MKLESDDFAVLVGNDVNNTVEGMSWSDLLNGLTQHLSVDVDFLADKPFPLAYEEIYFKTIKSTTFTESDIKKYVAIHVSEIKSGKIHQLINSLRTNDILTTNYDLSLEDANNRRDKTKLTNKGYIVESKYSLFRKHIVNATNYWHIHGSSTAHLSITLGYEHYSGYLQHMRNYVVSGTEGTYKKRRFVSLKKRIKMDEVENLSWVDLFFTKNIHIFGLSLDFIETDLWWLLTIRAKFKHDKKLNIRNNIYYYIPSEYLTSSKSKIDLLESVGVIVEAVDGYTQNKEQYYVDVLSKIEQRNTK